MSDALDAVGKDHLTLNRTPEAITAPTQATPLAPGDPRILLHYSHAPTRGGRRNPASRRLCARLVKLR